MRHIRLRPRIRAAACLLAATTWLAACDAPAPVAGNHAQHPGQSLKRGLGAEPGTLDPQLAADNAALTVVADLHEGLTAEDERGSIVPGGAESWTVERGGLEYTFRLRRGLRWSNGDALTADHFAAGLRHALDPATAAPNGGLLADVAAVEVVAPDVLRLRLRRPVSYLPAVLALPVAAPRHPRAQHPGERIELERNPYYWNSAGVAVDRVIHVVVADLATEVNLYRTGELDLTSEVPNAQLDSLRTTLPGELRLTPYLSVYSYAVNLARLQNHDARLALAMAIDRERIVRQVTGAGEQPAFGWVPDGIAGYTPARFEWSHLDHTSTVAEARRLWSKARHSGDAPARIRLCTDASANHRRTAVAVADFWRTELGIETEIVELEWNVYLDARAHPGYDRLLAASRKETDAARRMAELASAEAQLLADAPVIPLFFRVSKRLVKPHVQGVATNPLGHVGSRHLQLVAPQKKGAGGP